MSPLDAVPDPEDISAHLEAGEEPPHASSLTDVTAEALRSGLSPLPSDADDEIPGGDDARLRAGDPDVDPLDNEYSGDEMPGASMPAPDQNNLDEVGRAYGLTDIDSGALSSTEELLTRRDAHRFELDPRSKDPES